MTREDCNRGSSVETQVQRVEEVVLHAGTEGTPAMAVWQEVKDAERDQVHKLSVAPWRVVET